MVCFGLALLLPLWFREKLIPLNTDSLSAEFHWARYQRPAPSPCLKLQICEQYFAQFHMPLLI